VTTKRILLKEQTAERGYLRRVLGVTLRDKDHRSEIRKARDVEPLLRIERSGASQTRTASNYLDRITRNNRYDSANAGRSQRALSTSTQ